MALQEGTAGSPPSMEDDGGASHALMDEMQLRAALCSLTQEVRGLRAAAKERDSLQGLVGQLREANQNLVMATLDAQTLRDDAEAANLRQNEFLAMLAHELRNPLAPISMAGIMLTKTPAQAPELLNLQKIIGRQVKHLARLLDDLLDAARISSGKITLSLRPLMLADLLERTVETVQARLSERRQTLTLSKPPEDFVIDADQVRLTQAFSNLLVNASKFTQDGGKIALRIMRADDKVVVTVEDNGAGISPEVIPHIFSLFTQGPRSLARSEGGLGVGLNIVRNVVEMHAGSVAASSDGLGAGSIFSVTLPLSTSPLRDHELELHPAAPAHGYRILLVEDNTDASETLSMFLRYEGHTVATAYDGPSGLAMAQSHDFDVLICDIGLPGLDGYDLIRQLRKSTCAQIPFAIAVSGYGQEEARARAIAAGFGQFLVKPVDVDALLTLIESKAVTRLVGRDQ
jgi:signal transduction histidine kinase/ActR/RegA family two-component response regulator